ncbi:hypothetical protein KXD96_11795 [Mycobacterium sp. SMC-2]|uniref:hypothetical protein n=1 Tax=Mycobacterium sp. SMC-2 TaxID=2857058 RepID=UPI0021B20E27|nr:hypothetical protein [Mycobacterium sp. SMC-2]UXA08684.1 hypothetical protein KXD96_11795 [Mycobacterium sp. SMC-2]
MTVTTWRDLEGYLTKKQHDELQDRENELTQSGALRFAQAMIESNAINARYAHIEVPEGWFDDGWEEHRWEDGYSRTVSGTDYGHVQPSGRQWSDGRIDDLAVLVSVPKGVAPHMSWLLSPEEALDLARKLIASAGEIVNLA